MAHGVQGYALVRKSVDAFCRVIGISTNTKTRGFVSSGGFKARRGETFSEKISSPRFDLAAMIFCPLLLRVPDSG